MDTDGKKSPSCWCNNCQITIRWNFTNFDIIVLMLYLMSGLDLFFKRWVTDYVKYSGEMLLLNVKICIQLQHDESYSKSWWWPIKKFRVNDGMNEEKLLLRPEWINLVIVTISAAWFKLYFLFVDVAWNYFAGEFVVTLFKFRRRVDWFVDLRFDCGV